MFGYEKTYDFMSKRYIFLSVSAFLIIASIVLLVTRGLNFGIDFLGGTIIQVKYDQQAPLDLIRKALENSSLKDSSIKEFGDKDEIIIRLNSSSENLAKDISQTVEQTLKDTGKFEIRRIDMVGAKVGDELRQKGISAVILALVGVLIYISVRFEWRFAVVAVLALMHDILISVGAVVLFDVTANLEILAALLTILGFSLNDTIIIFDRIREDLSSQNSNQSLAQIINHAVSRTLSRTTLTSLTVFFVVFVLYLFGGELINGLSFTIMVGVIIGTYSSIFVAANMLDLFGFSVTNWKEKEAKKALAKKEKQRMRSQFEQGIL